MADHGICIGINGYPGLTDLKGPCNDALAFENWLTDPNKGGLETDNVRTILSTNYGEPPASIAEARPFLNDMEALFVDFVKAGAERKHEDGRLFIFVAGHGFADQQDADSAALYAANAQQVFATNLAVKKYVDFLRRQWVFDEIILIMDACRTTSVFHKHW